MTNHQQFILRLGPAILFQIEIGDNNGAVMTDHFILMVDLFSNGAKLLKRFCAISLNGKIHVFLFLFLKVFIEEDTPSAHTADAYDKINIS